MLIAGLMQLPMMAAAERDRKLIADLETDSPWLGKAKMVGVRRLSTADQARLRGDKLQMLFVTQSFGFGIAS